MELTDHFTILETVIKSRRNTKPDKMNGKKIPTAEMQSLFDLADWAPTHGFTEPWRFVVYADEMVGSFCNDHAALYKFHTADEKYETAKYEKLLHMGDKASHIVIAIMQRGSLPKIPAWEERAATACAVQNILLGATALGIASYWGSGGMTTHPAMKDYLGLRDEDEVMGILYFGYSDTTIRGERNVLLSEKVRWNN